MRISAFKFVDTLTSLGSNSFGFSFPININVNFSNLSYTGCMRYKVPQNIAMEDRVAGPLTFTQFWILVVGSGIAYSAYMLLRPIAPVNTYIAGILGVITAIISVGRFNGQPMFKIGKSLISYLFTPHTRVWSKGGRRVQVIKATPEKPTATTKNGPRKARADLGKLADIVDSRGRKR